MINYDPNITRYINIQRVKLTLAQWEYRTERVIEVHSNCAGLEVIKSAIFQLYQSLEDYPAKIVLTKENGDTLTCEDDNDDLDEWLNNMVISAEILDLNKI